MLQLSICTVPTVCTYCAYIRTYLNTLLDPEMMAKVFPVLRASDEDQPLVQLGVDACLVHLRKCIGELRWV